MALSENINNLEKDKFKEVASETAVRVAVVETVGGGGGGDATAANQVLEIAELTDINANTDALPTALGQTTMAASLPVVIASNQTAVPISAASLPLPTGASTEVTLQAVLDELELKADLTETQPVSAASLPLPTGAATETTLASVLTSVDGVEALLTGIATAANQTSEITQLTAINANTDNLPTVIGQTTMAASLPVVIASNQSAVPISAASLPLPTGAATLAEQQTQTTSLSTLDDWDESDRAKVNLIVGQAGVAAGTGVDGATVQRVTLATNVALPAGTNIIGALSANQSVNCAQMNGVAVTMGNGVSGTGVQRVTIASDSTGTSIVTQATAANLNAQVVGNIAHDTADAGNPVKIGGKSLTNTSTPTAVSTTGDRVDAFFDMNGFQHIKNHVQESAAVTITGLDNTYNATLTYNSGDITTTGYASFGWCFSIVSAGTPTGNLTFRLQQKIGSNYFDYPVDWWGSFTFSDASVATQQNIWISGPCPPSGTMRIIGDSVGTDGAGNTYTCSNNGLYLSTVPWN